MRVERFALEAAGDEWDLLAEQSGNIFATKEWISIWWRHFGTHEPYLARVHAGDGRLVAIMPLYCWSRRPLRIVRFLGHGPGDELGPVCAPADRLQAGHALREVASTLPWRWDVLLAEYLPGTGWARLDRRPTIAPTCKPGSGVARGGLGRFPRGAQSQFPSTTATERASASSRPWPAVPPLPGPTDTSVGSDRTLRAA